MNHVPSDVMGNASAPDLHGRGWNQPANLVAGYRPTSTPG